MSNCNSPTCARNLGNVQMDLEWYKSKLALAVEALEYGIDMMMPEIHTQRQIWPAEVDGFEERALEALARIRGEL